MSIIMYNDIERTAYHHHASIIYSHAGVTYPDYAKSAVTNVLDGYSIVHGLPVIIKYNRPIEVKYDGSVRPMDCTFNCIDIISSMADRYGAVPCKDFLNLLSRIEQLQKKAIWLDMNNNLSLETMKIMDEQLYECYDKLLYLYICAPVENLVDYTPSWKKEQEDELSLEFLPLLGEVYLFKNVITTGIMAKRQKRKPPFLTNCTWCYQMAHYAEQELERIL